MHSLLFCLTDISFLLFRNERFERYDEKMNQTPFAWVLVQKKEEFVYFTIINLFIRWLNALKNVITSKRNNDNESAPTFMKHFIKIKQPLLHNRAQPILHFFWKNFKYPPYLIIIHHHSSETAMELLYLEYSTIFDMSLGWYVYLNNTLTLLNQSNQIFKIFYTWLWIFIALQTHLNEWALDSVNDDFDESLSILRYETIEQVLSYFNTSFYSAKSPKEAHYGHSTSNEDIKFSTFNGMSKDWNWYHFVHVNVGCEVSFQYGMHGMIVGWRTSYMSFMNSF